ncbi:MAG: succinate dehydrogenase cytochrome b subunit [Croceitalea sp.]|nr:succinate dehydrogenase cytochrome b subunit [Croceitalea sp.]MBT8238725.1 succinate dehydrogenase cytochrome b subunit [Croceitalea sp.]NNC33968.1 succinate dehydrogenase cytochrome b subunit [Croceitalea sp.]NNL09592.1 succinate dehydrogenase cytochrome b subunit [Croceitalea sp.]NNM18411.1 succinate dehydrogenase cytochrome b subunit [Croceitalea sp.]
MSGLIKSSLARKVVMALSGLFLVIFLVLHVTINLASVISPEFFNEASHFMGYNPIVQFLMQPILIAGVIVHFVMGFVLEFQNRAARNVRYAKFNGGANAPWVSRNMIYSGLVVLAFLGLHFYDFWIHEMAYKYVEANPEDPTRYYAETVEKFAPMWRTVLYVVSFVLLSLHLWHGFASSFQTMGVNNKYTPAIKSFTKLFSVVVPLAFAFIAIYHHLNPITH